MVDRITPYTLAAALEQSLRDTLKDMRISQARRLNLKRFDMGTAPPRMLAARAYDVGPEAMAFDVDVQWDSALVAEIEMVTKPIGARVPVSVRNVRFEGTVRAVLTPLVPGGPGYGAMLLSLPAPPALKMEVRPNPNRNPNPNPNRNPSPNANPNQGELREGLEAMDARRQRAAAEGAEARHRASSNPTPNSAAAGLAL